MGEKGLDGKKVKGLSKEHIYIKPIDTVNREVMVRGGPWLGGGTWRHL